VASVPFMDQDLYYLRWNCRWLFPGTVLVESGVYRKKTLEEQKKEKLNQKPQAMIKKTRIFSLFFAFSWSRLKLQYFGNFGNCPILFFGKT